MKNLSLFLAGVAVLPATGLAQNLMEPKTGPTRIKPGLMFRCGHRTSPSPRPTAARW